MSRVWGVWSRVRAVLGRGAAESRMEEEFRFHLERETEANERRGHSRAEARRRALLAFGGVDAHREEMRDGRGARWLEDLVRDVGGAVRSLGRRPGMAVTAVLSIGIGVGATTAVFSFAVAVLYPTLPVPGADRLFALSELRSGMVSTIAGQMAVPYERYEGYAASTREVFAGVAAHRPSPVSVRIGDEAVSAEAVLVSGNYFEVLGLSGVRGRHFTADREPAVVLSDRLWRERFGGDPAAVGRTISVDSRAFTVAGVAPPGFGGAMLGQDSDLWVPHGAYHPEEPGGFTGWVLMFGRLAPGVSAQRAAVVVDAVGRRLPADPITTVRGVRLEPQGGLPSFARGMAFGFFGLLLATAALVLLIACANIAGLLLALAESRRREVAVRLALGAGRGRIVRQLLTESVVLFALGGGAGVFLAVQATRLLARIRLPMSERFAIVDASPDPLVLGGGLALAAAAGVIFGLAPALRSSRPDLIPALKEGVPGATVGGRRGRSVFVAGQLALSVLLLVTAMLFVRSLRAGLAVDPGLDVEGVAVGAINVAPHGYEEERGRLFFDRLLVEVRALPGVESASLARLTLLTGNRHGGDMRAGPTPDAPVANGSLNIVDASWLEAMRIPLVAGRGFEASDRVGARQVAIVNETMARTLWPEGNAVGQRLYFDGDAEVIGVARDGKYIELGEDPTPFVFYPFAQRYRPHMTLHVRSARPAAEVLGDVRGVLRRLDPNVALEAPASLEARMGFSLFPQRFAAVLIGAFGVIGLLLAGIGVHGVLAFEVARRTREFGIRTALGAGVGGVLRLVLRRGALLAAAGALVGLGLAAAAGRLLESFLFGIRPLDPVSFLVVPVILAGVALVASALPAIRAARVAPMEALRQE